MASPALTAFNAAIDAMSINAANKTIAKNHGTTLYTGATQEEAAHVLRHLDAAIALATGAELSRLQTARDVIEGITTDTAPHVGTDVATYLTPSLETVRAWKWARGLTILLLSRSVAEAQARWDEFAIDGIPAALVIRLKALRDLITTNLGA